MPVYSYRCEDCELMIDDITSIAHRNDSRQCLSCGGEMRLKIMPTMVQPVMGGGSFPGYECPVTGEFVTSRKRRREIMAENSLTEKS